MTADPHPESVAPIPSPAFTSLSPRKEAEHVEQFIADVVVVERHPQVEGTVEDEKDEIGDKDR